MPNLVEYRKVEASFQATEKTKRGNKPLALRENLEAWHAEEEGWLRRDCNRDSREEWGWGNLDSDPRQSGLPWG